VHQDGPVLPQAGERRPRLEVADIFRAHGEVYRQKHALTPEQRATMRAIEACRTEVLGGHVDVCDACGLTRPAYNSRRNRHCPKCQALTRAAWIDKRMEHVLPTHYFHVVFTLPHELGPLALRNRTVIFNLLFSTTAATLLELGKDARRLGALLGITAVLHTWSRDLRFHPHLHCIVTGGGLAVGAERWVSSRQKYLFPVRVLSDLFRGNPGARDRFGRQARAGWSCSIADVIECGWRSCSLINPSTMYGPTPPQRWRRGPRAQTSAEDTTRLPRPCFGEEGEAMRSSSGTSLRGLFVGRRSRDQTTIEKKSPATFSQSPSRLAVSGHFWDESQRDAVRDGLFRALGLA
jgi:hypothetical protein